MIKTWIVECDNCGREIDASQESFTEQNGQQLCEQCANDKDPILNEYIVRWVGIIKGSQKVRAKNPEEAEKKASNNMDIISDENEPDWNIEEVEKS